MNLNRNEPLPVATFPHKPEAQHEMERLAENYRTVQTAPTGYVHHDAVRTDRDVFGSGSEWYGDHWDSGFAQPGDPYGIQSEYVAQSASPNAALPTQARADAIVAAANAERVGAVVVDGEHEWIVGQVIGWNGTRMVVQSKTPTGFVLVPAPVDPSTPVLA